MEGTSKWLNWSKSYYTETYKKNTIFKSFGPLVSKRVWEEPPFSDFILYVVRIIVLKFHGNRSTGTKVIVRKPMCLQTDNRIIYDRKLFLTYRPRFFSACNQNHTYYFVWPKTLIRYEIYILSYRSSFFLLKLIALPTQIFFSMPWNHNHTYYFVWPKTLIRYKIYILSYFFFFWLKLIVTVYYM